MINAIKVKCKSCGIEQIFLTKENVKIKTPFICVNCFNIKAIDNIRSKHYDLGVGAEISGYKMFLGYKHKVKYYNPLVLVLQK